MTALPQVVFEELVRLVPSETLPSLGASNRVMLTLAVAEAVHRLARKEKGTVRQIEQVAALFKQFGVEVKAQDVAAAAEAGPTTFAVPRDTVKRLGGRALCRLTAYHLHIERLLTTHAHDAPSDLVASLKEGACPVCSGAGTWRSKEVKGGHDLQCKGVVEGGKCGARGSLRWVGCRRRAGGQRCAKQVLVGLHRDEKSSCSVCRKEAGSGCCPLRPTDAPPKNGSIVLQIKRMIRRPSKSAADENEGGAGAHARMLCCRCHEGVFCGQCKRDVSSDGAVCGNCKETFCPAHLRMGWCNSCHGYCF